MSSNRKARDSYAGKAESGGGPRVICCGTCPHYRRVTVAKDVTSVLDPTQQVRVGEFDVVAGYGLCTESPPSAGIVRVTNIGPIAAYPVVPADDPGCGQHPLRKV